MRFGSSRAKCNLPGLGLAFDLLEKPSRVLGMAVQAWMLKDEDDCVASPRAGRLDAARPMRLCCLFPEVQSTIQTMGVHIATMRIVIIQCGATFLLMGVEP